MKPTPTLGLALKNWPNDRFKLGGGSSSITAEMIKDPGVNESYGSSPRRSVSRFFFNLFIFFKNEVRGLSLQILINFDPFVNCIVVNLVNFLDIIYFTFFFSRFAL